MALRMDIKMVFPEDLLTSGTGFDQRSHPVGSLLQACELEHLPRGMNESFKIQEPMRAQ